MGGYLLTCRIADSNQKKSETRITTQRELNWKQSVSNEFNFKEELSAHKGLTATKDFNGQISLDSKNFSRKKL